MLSPSVQVQELECSKLFSLAQASFKLSPALEKGSLLIPPLLARCSSPHLLFTAIWTFPWGGRRAVGEDSLHSSG